MVSSDLSDHEVAILLLGRLTLAPGVARDLVLRSPAQAGDAPLMTQPLLSALWGYTSLRITTPLMVHLGHF